jgi:hypothetical protein
LALKSSAARSASAARPLGVREHGLDVGGDLGDGAGFGIFDDHVSLLLFEERGNRFETLRPRDGFRAGCSVFEAMILMGENASRTRFPESPRVWGASSRSVLRAVARAPARAFPRTMYFQMVGGAARED